MKKGFIVLLVALLAACSVFAATMSGNASINAGYNLETTEWGLKNGTGMSAGFTFELAADSGDFGSKGEGDLYAEIAADFYGEIVVGEDETVWKDKGYVWTQVPSLNGTGSWVGLGVDGVWRARITKANIIYKDITFGILNAGGGYDYAKTYYKEVSDSVTHTYKADSKVKMGKTLVDGFTVTYSDLFTAGFGATGKGTDEYKIFGQAQLTAIENLKLAGYGYLANDKKEVGAAAAYTFEADKLSASAAADFTYKSGVKAALEVSANATYENYSVDAYYVTVDNFNTNKLDAKVSAKFDEGIVASASAEVRDIIGNAQKISAAVNFNEGIVITKVTGKTNLGAKTFEVGCEGKVDAFKFGASYGTKYDFSAHTVKANVEYKANMFTAKANTTVGFTSDAVTKAEVGASITSTKLIDNCTVSLAYSKADFAKTADHNLGKIDLSATVAF